MDAKQRNSVPDDFWTAEAIEERKRWARENGYPESVAAIGGRFNVETLTNDMDGFQIPTRESRMDTAIETRDAIRRRRPRRLVAFLSRWKP